MILEGKEQDNCYHFEIQSHRFVGPVILLKHILHSVFSSVSEHHNHFIAIGSCDIGLKIKGKNLSVCSTERKGAILKTDCRNWMVNVSVHSILLTNALTDTIRIVIALYTLAS